MTDNIERERMRGQRQTEQDTLFQIKKHTYKDTQRAAAVPRVSLTCSLVCAMMKQQRRGGGKRCTCVCERARRAKERVRESQRERDREREEEEEEEEEEEAQLPPLFEHPEGN